MRWFRGSEPPVKAPAKSNRGQRVTRRSTGFSEFTRALAGYPELSVLDLGRTSPTNIDFLIKYGGRVYNEDVLHASHDPAYRVRNEEGEEKIDVEKFFAENLEHPEGRFDAILVWDIPDFLEESLVKPMVQRLHKILRPGGMLLAFFHTKDAGQDSPYCHYHIMDGDALELEPGPDFRLQRVFNNRHVENLFKDFSSRKFFLARDNVREVLVVR